MATRFLGQRRLDGGGEAVDVEKVSARAQLRNGARPRRYRQYLERWGHMLVRVARTHPGMFAIYVLVLILLVLGDHACLLATNVAVRLQISPRTLLVALDGQQLSVALDQPATACTFESAAPDIREFQIDGTDNTNNLTESIADLRALVPTPAYQFEAWMRGRYSVWSAVAVTDTSTRATVMHPGPSIALRPSGGGTTGTWSLVAWLERPESPASIVIKGGDRDIATVYIDRNSRALTVAGGGSQQLQAYFPEQPLPFIAEVADSLMRVAIWAWVLLAITSLLAILVSGAVGALSASMSGSQAFTPRSSARKRASFDWHLWQMSRNRIWRLIAALSDHLSNAAAAPDVSVRFRPWRQWLSRLTIADLTALGVVTGAFVWVAWIAGVQYQMTPHILDASAYYFQAKIFASGRLSAPAPADLAAFQGPFMVVWQGRWFAQYPPMTSALLALGMLAHAPWLVEPLLGTAALLGLYCLGRRLFGQATALLALILGALSPFYAFLAASYLSHTVALCCEVYFLWFLIRFADWHKMRHLVMAALCLVAMFCTRELNAMLVGGVACAWIAYTHRRALWADRAEVVPGLVTAGALLIMGFLLYLTYNTLQTGDPLLLPRSVFSSADRYGFGDGVGFYGRHTLAAGMLVLDQLLTALLIDLYGWPYYLSLAMIPLAFLRQDERTRWDLFCLVVASVLFLAQAGYFYHGIFLGPRYLYETLPFLLLLTARGCRALAHVCTQMVSSLRHAGVTTHAQLGSLTAVAGVVTVLLAFNLGFYMPRQISQHAAFTGLPANLPVDAAAIYHAPLRNAVVLTDNWMIYNYILWPLNDPDLHNSVIYAYAPTQETSSRVASEYPSRSILKLTVDGTGRVTFVPWGA